jgi:hypothetical protein
MCEVYCLICKKEISEVLGYGAFRNPLHKMCDACVDKHGFIIAIVMMGAAKKEIDKIRSEKNA